MTRRSTFRFEKVKPGRDRLAGSMCNTKKIIHNQKTKQNSYLGIKKSTIYVLLDKKGRFL
ncbi:hypothetical protein CN954_20630 [Bacillus cereus]|nr:hypothetical protein CN954_20630 [Bacillus cereus]